MRHPGLPKSAQAELNRSGLKWRIERKTNHDAIVVGQQVVTYITRSRPHGPTQEKNLLAAIRRFSNGIRINKYRNNS